MLYERHGQFPLLRLPGTRAGRIGDERTQKIQKVGYGFERIVNLVSNGRCHSARGSYLLGLEE